MSRTAAQNRRYRLYQKIKAELRYDARKRLLYVPSGSEVKPDVLELQDGHGYCVQLEIPM